MVEQEKPKIVSINQVLNSLRVLPGNSQEFSRGWQKTVLNIIKGENYG